MTYLADYHEEKPMAVYDRSQKGGDLPPIESVDETNAIIACFGVFKPSERNFVQSYFADETGQQKLARSIEEYLDSWRDATRTDTYKISLIARWFKSQAPNPLLKNLQDLSKNHATEAYDAFARGLETSVEHH